MNGLVRIYDKRTVAKPMEKQYKKYYDNRGYARDYAAFYVSIRLIEALNKFDLRLVNSFDRKKTK